VLSRNGLSTGIGTGTATVGAEFSLTRDGAVRFTDPDFIAALNR